MKIESNEPEFKPIEIKITIESEEEREILEHYLLEVSTKYNVKYASRNFVPYANGSFAYFINKLFLAVKK